PESIAKRPLDMLEEITSLNESHLMSTLGRDETVFALKSTVIFNEFHQIINQKAIPIINQPLNSSNVHLRLS
ncbi:MAG: hypothetical protein AB2608_02930, partial [Candidatus Thiodiazotropha sp.]